MEQKLDKSASALELNRDSWLCNAAMSVFFAITWINSLSQIKDLERQKKAADVYLVQTMKKLVGITLYVLFYSLSVQLNFFVHILVLEMPISPSHVWMLNPPALSP